MVRMEGREIPEERSSEGLTTQPPFLKKEVTTCLPLQCIFRKQGGVQKSMGHKRSTEDWDANLSPVTLRLLIFPQNEAVCLPVTSRPPIWQPAFQSFISLELRDPWNGGPFRNTPLFKIITYLYFLTTSNWRNDCLSVTLHIMSLNLFWIQCICLTLHKLFSSAGIAVLLSSPGFHYMYGFWLDFKLSTKALHYMKCVWMNFLLSSACTILELLGVEEGWFVCAYDPWVMQALRLICFRPGDGLQPVFRLAPQPKHC